MTREEIKAKLISLDIEFKDNAPTTKLQELLGEPTEEIEEPRVNKRIVRPAATKASGRAMKRAKAMKRSRVIIYCNDKRNAEDKECFSSVRNSYFGDAKVFPIGVEWWVPQMHIDNLKGIEYTAFVSDREGNKTPKSARKYTVDILETDEAAYKAKLAKTSKK